MRKSNYLVLGAAALGDIGHLFPDTDDRWKGADSLKLLEEVVRVRKDLGYPPLGTPFSQMCGAQACMKGSPGSALHAMHRPQHLRAIGHLDAGEGSGAGVVRGEGAVVGRVPVLREHHVGKARRDAVDDGHDGVAVRYGQAAAGHEAVLCVDDDQCRGVVKLVHGFNNQKGHQCLIIKRWRL